MRIIFLTTVKIKKFRKILTKTCIDKKIRIINFFLSLFETEYLELKVIAIDLFLYCPIDVREFIKNDLKKLPDIIKIIEILLISLDS